MIVENGVTYNVYADPQGRDRPWQLDTLPLILPANEWQMIATGVAQRAKLLDRLLADLYGPQRLLTEGIVPPETRVRPSEFSLAVPRAQSSGWTLAACVCR